MYASGAGVRARAGRLPEIPVLSAVTFRGAGVSDAIRDITIIGAGPSGLFGAFYAGMRGASVRLLDALPDLGGQLTALYPEKYIYDVAGFPRILAKDLVKGLVQQAMQFQPEVHVAQEVTAMRTETDDTGREILAL